MFDQNFAEEVPESELRTNWGQVWYIVHHGVYHKQKKKIRVVFDCALKYRGVSLNNALYTGPDFTNSLLGVLLRFRERKVAVMADIEKMFYQVRIPKAQSNFLRFFWFKDGDLNGDPVECRLRVHVFGAVSSPSCANYALRQSALDNQHQASSKTIKEIENGFYVDDFVVSVEDSGEAQAILSEVKMICVSGGFNLTQFTSNDRDVLSSIDRCDLSKMVRDLDFSEDDLPTERALGVTWCAETDSFGFEVAQPCQPNTRKGILSSIYAIFDPFGLIGPAILPAKQLLQEMCKRGCDWDEDVPIDLGDVWNQWKSELDLLSKYHIPRWIGVSGEGMIVQLHTFCDGSEVGYGAVTYMRVEVGGKTLTTLMLAKSRLAPLKKMTIPRLELAGAKLGVELASVLQRERSIPVSAEYFWTDSQTVLKYLANKRKRFQRFVFNRISFIRERTEVAQWNHVPVSMNPADLASRGLPIRDFIVSDLWKSGPSFLKESKRMWPRAEDLSELRDDDPEIIKDQIISAATCGISTNPIIEWFGSVSNWGRLKRMVAGLIRVKTKLLGDRTTTNEDSLAGLLEAEQIIIKQAQAAELSAVFKRISLGQELEKKCVLRRLSPFIDNQGLLRVGGRLNRTKDLEYNRKNPIIVPRGHVATLLVHEAHELVGHLGKESVLAKLRDNWWVIGAVPLVKKILRECVQCKKYHGRVIDQLMSDLPEDRLRADQPPFTNTGVDLFGPFPVVRGRSTVERHGVVFTCLSSRAIHLEVVFDKSTDSFIQALKRFMARRGQVKVMRSDNGTNFVGAERELRGVFHDLKHDEIRGELQTKHIEWIFNPPYAHHFGGVWEREIRTMRRVLSGLMCEQPRSFTDESLSTLLCEVEAIMNSRPLTPVSDDPSDLEALTPNHLLLLKSGPTFPPGIFERSDCYGRRRWKQIQYLADLFWNCWRREYLASLLQRQKWTKTQRNVQVGDLVLVVQENVSRYRWPLARVLEVFPSPDQKVRQVRLKTTSGEYLRPISQLVLVQGNTDKKEELGRNS
ncbi:uncharacterized protein LOC131883340 [Tigriopus californicus]|uniref:uncharacterized protein LOC131883340 n=1 Tax=Tigriopus californicus TaxID=6832 RepID=UPI0027DA3003|nr:uncharacterized protein LOC131883340 [Tigriopus californicus]